MDRTERMSPPLQAPDALLSREARMQQVQQQREVIAQLRDVARSAGDAQLLREADALAVQYMVADRAPLGDDVYRSAAHQPAAVGLGYYRGSEHPEMVRALGVTWSDADIKTYLQPDGSDFRAEIYIPDPAVFGPDAKPVIAYKGSNGPVFALDERGVGYLRESASQDWTENGRQGLGMESDHYNRSMAVATAFKLAYDGPFDNVGHSKGGGQAQAGSAVTGMPAYTFNSATLHPATAARYVEQNGGTLFDAAALNHGYYVKGEVLHDGLALTQGMDARHQQQLGDTLRYVGELAQMPHVRTYMGQTLRTLWPYDEPMQRDAVELLDTLAKDAGAQTLRQVPQPAVNLVALDAKQRDASGALVDRMPNASLADVERNAGPVLGILSTTGAAMVVGKRVGDGVAAGGRAVEQGAEAVGSTVETIWQMSGQVVRSGAEAQGRIVGGSIRYGGEAVAGMRVAGGHAEALVDRAQAQAAEWSNATSSRVLRAASQLPLLGGLHQVADQRDRETAAYVRDKQGDAAAAVRGAERDAAEVRQGASDVGHTVTSRYSTAGATFDAGLRRVGVSVHGAYSDFGGAVRGTTAWAPEAGAALIGAPTLAAKVIATHVPSAPVDLPRAAANVTASRELAAQVKAVQPTKRSRGTPSRTACSPAWMRTRACWRRRRSNARSACSTRASRLATRRRLSGCRQARHQPRRRPHSPQRRPRH